MNGKLNSKTDYHNKVIEINTIEKDIYFLKEALNSNKVTVSNAGLYNVGKSSFFNALIDSKEAEFKVADRRETSKNKLFSWTEDIDLVDTPGIDAFNDEDKFVALKSFKNSDVILFLHNINQGELVRSEIDFINELSRLFPKDEFWNRVVFIMTRIDLKEDDDEYPQIISNIKSQISKLSNGAKYEFFEVSSEKYLEGYNEDFGILMEESNIIAVRNAIKLKSSTLKGSKKDLNNKKIESHLKKLTQTKLYLSKLRKEKVSNIVSKDKCIENEEQNLESIMSDIKYEWEKVKTYKNSL